MKRPAFLLAASILGCGCDLAGDDVACTGNSVLQDGVCRCPAGSQRVNGECVTASPVAVGDGGAEDAATTPPSGLDAGASLDPLALCRDAGTCARWPMPDSVRDAKFRPLYSVMQDVVVDEVTGLIWQRSTPAAYPGCTVYDGKQCAFEEASAYCDNLVLAGASDWRMPSRLELESLIEQTRFDGPSIDPALPTVPAGYWTSTKSAWDPSNFAWTVSFDARSGRSQDYFLGLVSGLHTTPTEPLQSRMNPAYVRCVRGGPDAGALPARYTAGATNETIVDRWTGLEWRKAMEAEASAPNAKLKCVALGSGWRLPTLKELLTLVDASRISPAIDEEVFEGSRPEPLWSSTPSQLDPMNSTWHVDFGQRGTERARGMAGGFTTTENNDALHRARCVR